MLSLQQVSSASSLPLTFKITNSSLHGGFAATSPLIALEGTVTHEASGRLGSDIRVYGVDERFWNFHGRQNQAPLNREILISDSLARELGASAGDALSCACRSLPRFQSNRCTVKKEDLGRTLRLTLRERFPRRRSVSFPFKPQQGATRAVFVPLRLLQKELEQEGKANLILVDEDSTSETDSATQTVKTELLGRILKNAASLEDYGIKLRVLNEQQMLSVESSAGFVPETLPRAWR